jgi:hypothetical protein
MSGRRCISWNTRGENVGLRRREGEGRRDGEEEREDEHAKQEGPFVRVGQRVKRE